MSGPALLGSGLIARCLVVQIWTSGRFLKGWRKGAFQRTHKGWSFSPDACDLDGSRVLLPFWPSACDTAFVFSDKFS